jgi:hypothetical protein
MCLNFFPMNDYQNVIQFNKIHKRKFQINLHFWNIYIYIIMCVIESILKINFMFFHVDKYQ